MIRKIQFAPANNKAGPKAEIAKQFMMTDKPVHLEASLEKEVNTYTKYMVFTRTEKNITKLLINCAYILDLLPWRSSLCQCKNKQRNQQGGEENQDHR